MKLILTIFSGLALSVAALPQATSGSGGLCHHSHGCEIDSTTSTLPANEKRQVEPAWPTITVAHGFVPVPTTLEKSSTWDLGERSSTWDILPTTAIANEKLQAGWPACTIIHGFLRCPTSSTKSSAWDLGETSSSWDNLPTSSSFPGATPTPKTPQPENKREEHTPTYIPVHAVARGEDYYRDVKTKPQSTMSEFQRPTGNASTPVHTPTKRTEASTFPCGTAFGLYTNAPYALLTYYSNKLEDQVRSSSRLSYQPST